MSQSDRMAWIANGFLWSGLACLPFGLYALMTLLSVVGIAFAIRGLVLLWAGR